MVITSPPAALACHAPRPRHARNARRVPHADELAGRGGAGRTVEGLMAKTTGGLYTYLAGAAGAGG
jgi:hypothetical protein